MADLTITATGVIASAAAVVLRGIAGDTITAGQALYHDADGTMKLSDGNGNPVTTPGINTVQGISLHAASAGQPIRYAVSDPNFKPGFATTTTAGMTYYLSSATPGSWCTDVPTTGMYTTILGIGKVTGVAGVGTVTLQLSSAGVAV